MLAAIATGEGLVSARTLRELRVDPRRVARWVGRGQLVPVRWGVYTTAELWESWDEYRDRPLARVRAVAMTLRIPYVFSHDSAALIHAMPLLQPQHSGVHVTRLHLRGSRTTSGVHHHGARYQPDQVTEVGGLSVLDPARTATDIAREHGYTKGLVAADGAMQLGVSRAALASAAEAMAGWPESLVVNAVVAAADPGAESAAETLGRELLEECGFDEVETQFPVSVPRGVAWCDLRVGRHLVEVDGLKKILPVADGGVTDRAAAQVLWDERRRQHEACSGGFGMSRLAWADFFGPARDRAKKRVLAEKSVTDARFGTDLSPEQAEFAARLRGRRYRTAG